MILTITLMILRSSLVCRWGICDPQRLHNISKVTQFAQLNFKFHQHLKFEHWVFWHLGIILKKKKKSSVNLKVITVNISVSTFCPCVFVYPPLSFIYILIYFYKRERCSQHLSLNISTPSMEPIFLSHWIFFHNVILVLYSLPLFKGSMVYWPI